MIRLAVIGLGRMGRFYAQTLAALGPPVELYAVADPDQGARAAVQDELGLARVLASPEAVIALPEVDAVVVATPTSTHAEVLIAAAKARKAIFSEKPLALSLAQTHAALAAIEHAGVVLQVGFMRRFDPAYRRAYAAIGAGQIGRPVTFKGVGRDPSCPPLEYANPASSGGLLVDMGIHDFDLARWMMSSEVERVSAEGTLLVCDELKALGDIDNAVINLRFANGAIGNIDLSRNARYGYDVRTEVLGSTGAVIVGFPSLRSMESSCSPPSRHKATRRRSSSDASPRPTPPRSSISWIASRRVGSRRSAARTRWLLSRLPTPRLCPRTRVGPSRCPSSALWRATDHAALDHGPGAHRLSQKPVRRTRCG